MKAARKRFTNYQDSVSFMKAQSVSKWNGANRSIDYFLRLEIDTRVSEQLKKVKLDQKSELEISYLMYVWIRFKCKIILPNQDEYKSYKWLKYSITVLRFNHLRSLKLQNVLFSFKNRIVTVCTIKKFTREVRNTCNVDWNISVC